MVKVKFLTDGVGAAEAERLCEGSGAMMLQQKGSTMMFCLSEPLNLASISVPPPVFPLAPISLQSFPAQTAFSLRLPSSPCLLAGNISTQELESVGASNLQRSESRSAYRTTRRQQRREAAPDLDPLMETALMSLVVRSWHPLPLGSVPKAGMSLRRRGIKGHWNVL